ncbi:hypothetical protein K466DRAFT_281364 [Polyporus arcularius HHB13444]|uniref:Uncharacterized protein n=1 Tax=Polyporus arcularius HHB13444 TaxID=1314778 RepID=A0A5C3P1P1_9APHY|nr:hypothetical protein K466DRAFT_281364 [Polyporus arcularius HHB13444]
MAGSSPSRRRHVFLPVAVVFYRRMGAAGGTTYAFPRAYSCCKRAYPSQRGLSDYGGNIRGGPRRPQLRSDDPELQSNKEEEDDSGRFWTAKSEWTTMLLQAPARNEQIEPSARAHRREDSAARSTSRKAERMRLEGVLSAVRGTTRESSWERTQSSPPRARGPAASRPRKASAATYGARRRRSGWRREEAEERVRSRTEARARVRGSRARPGDSVRSAGCSMGRKVRASEQHERRHADARWQQAT